MNRKGRLVDRNSRLRFDPKSSSAGRRGIHAKRERESSCLCRASRIFQSSLISKRRGNGCACHRRNEQEDLKYDKNCSKGSNKEYGMKSPLNSVNVFQFHWGVLRCPFPPRAETMRRVEGANKIHASTSPPPYSSKVL